MRTNIFTNDTSMTRLKTTLTQSLGQKSGNPAFFALINFKSPLHFFGSLLLCFRINNNLKINKDNPKINGERTVETAKKNP